MHVTRRLFTPRSGGGVLPNGEATKLLLPKPASWDHVWNAIQGLWHVALNPKKRQAFEDAISSQVIKDTVLQNAYNGSTLTFNLFWNLQSPLWKRQPSFDIKEFSEGVGPALTNLHDFLHSFQNQIRQEYLEFQEEQEKSTTADQKESEDKGDEPTDLVLGGMPIDQNLFKLFPASSTHLVPFLKQKHPWRQQAADDPDSLAGRLSRMTTEEYLDGFVLSSKLGLAVTNNAVYEEGSAKVGQVAILGARAMEIPLPGQKDPSAEDDYRYEEFKASEEADLKMGVAAQIDVLYEVTNRFHEQVPVLPDEQSQQQQPQEPEWKTEHVEYTSLGVAVFEGWLDKGGDGSGNDEDKDVLHWKVPLMREPTEFPMTLSAMRTVLPPSEEKTPKAETSSESKKDEEKTAQEPENKPPKGEKSSSSSS
eukprot:scaffold34628_cov166-Amphora_coffeaeformis.AAC.12